MAGELRARDVRAMLKGRVDPAVSTVLETIAEQQFFLAKGSMDMGLIVMRMCDLMPAMMGIAEEARAAMDKMKTPDDGLGVIVEGEQVDD